MNEPRVLLTPENPYELKKFVASVSPGQIQVYPSRTSEEFIRRSNYYQFETLTVCENGDHVLHLNLLAEDLDRAKDLVKEYVKKSHPKLGKRLEL